MLNDGWIEWGGGECPVDKNAKVEFKSPGGASGLQRAKYLNWFHNGAGDDIIAYRVIENDGSAKINGDELERQKFERWFEREWRQKLIELETAAMQQRQFMQMAWYGWLARSKQEE